MLGSNCRVEYLDDFTKNSMRKEFDARVVILQMNTAFEEESQRN
jgi:hypothetical protein